MVLWTGSVVSLLYEAELCKVEERESFGALQVSTANCNCWGPNTFVCGVWVSHNGAVACDCHQNV